MLALALHQHSQAVCYGEVFRQNVAKERLPNVKHWPRKPRKMLLDFLSEYSDYQAAGFKLLWGHYYEAQRLTLGSPEWKKILLHRYNILAQYASWKHARASKRGILLSGEQDRRTEIYFCAEEFEKYRKTVQQRYDRVRPFVEKGLGGWLEVEYSNLVRNGFVDVLDFLGLPQENIQSPTQKRQTSYITYRFGNPEEAYRHLRQINQTDWEVE